MGFSNLNNESKWQRVKMCKTTKNDFSAFRKGKRHLTDEKLIVNKNNKINIYPLKAGVIIFNTDKTKVLSVQNNYVKKNGKWGFPKGHLEVLETISKCAQRELEEETSLKINISMNDPKVKINNTTYFIYFIDESIINKLHIIDTNEIRDIKFLDIDKISNMNTNKEMLLAMTKKLVYIIKKAKCIN